MRRDISSLYFCLGLFGFSVTLNILAILYLTGPNLIEPGSDENYYFSQAEFLLTEHRFPGILRTPLWPILLSAWWTLTGQSIFAGKVLNAFLGAAMVLGVFFLGQNWLTRRTAAVVSMAFAALPTFFYTNATLYSETSVGCAFIWLNVLLVFIACRADPDAKGILSSIVPLHWLLFGVGVALLNLIKPAFVLWAGMLLLVGIIHFRRALFRFSLAASLSSCAFVVAMTPWWVHNYVETGHFIPLATSGDGAFAGSNNPAIAKMRPCFVHQVGDRITSKGFAGRWIPLKDTTLLTPDELENLSSVEIRRLARNRAMNWIRCNPITWAILVLKKLGYGFSVWPIWQGTWQRLLAASVPFIILLLFSIPGWIWLTTHKGSHRILLLHPLAYTATVVLFLASLRYRLPYEPSFFIVSAIWLTRLVSRGQHNDGSCEMSGQQPQR